MRVNWKVFFIRFISLIFFSEVLSSPFYSYVPNGSIGLSVGRKKDTSNAGICSCVLRGHLALEFAG